MRSFQEILRSSVPEWNALRANNPSIIPSFRYADFRGVNLKGADLSGSVLTGAIFRGSDLSGSNLRGARVWSGVFSGADLRGADLRSTDLRWSNFQTANLRGADFTAANLAAVSWWRATMPWQKHLLQTCLDPKWWGEDILHFWDKVCDQTRMDLVKLLMSVEGADRESWVWYECGHDHRSLIVPGRSFRFSDVWRDGGITPSRLHYFLKRRRPAFFRRHKAIIDAMSGPA